MPRNTRTSTGTSSSLKRQEGYTFVGMGNKEMRYQIKWDGMARFGKEKGWHGMRDDALTSGFLKHEIAHFPFALQTKMNIYILLVRFGTPVRSAARTWCTPVDTCTPTSRITRSN